MSVWTQPKVDWTADDRFNISDYNRIKNNIIYVKELAESLYNEFDTVEMGYDIVDYSMYWDVNVFNAFEKNIERINQNIFSKDYGSSQTFYYNSPFIKWDELNRIEDALLSMKTMMDHQKSNMRRISFILGSDKGVKI